MSEWKPNIELIEGQMHQAFLREAYLYAWENSEEPTTKTGAVIVNDRRIIARGANHFPRGIVPTDEQISDRQWKYRHIIHAEPSAIYSAARKGEKLEGAVMYMPWVPCVPCAKAIVDSGIGEFIGHEAMIMMTPERWWDDCGYAVDFLGTCGVKMSMYRGKIGGVRSLFNGSEWEP